MISNKEDIKKEITLDTTQNIQLGIFEGEVIFAICKYGYTPAKIGSRIMFSDDNLYDFYIEAYLEANETTFDIYPYASGVDLVIANTLNGIKVKLFKSSIQLNDKKKAETTREKGQKLFNRLDTVIWAKAIEKMRKDASW